MMLLLLVVLLLPQLILLLPFVFFVYALPLLFMIATLIVFAMLLSSYLSRLACEAFDCPTLVAVVVSFSYSLSSDGLLFSLDLVFLYWSS
jgi:hypothetical protein